MGLDTMEAFKIVPTDGCFLHLTSARARYDLIGPVNATASPHRGRKGAGCACWTSKWRICFAIVVSTSGRLHVVRKVAFLL